MDSFPSTEGLEKMKTQSYNELKFYAVIFIVLGIISTSFLVIFSLNGLIIPVLVLVITTVYSLMQAGVYGERLDNYSKNRRWIG